MRHLAWDGRELGDWAAEVDGADAVVNLRSHRQLPLHDENRGR